MAKLNLSILLLDLSFPEVVGGGQMYFCRLAHGLSDHYNIVLSSTNKFILDSCKEIVNQRTSDDALRQLHCYDVVIVNDINPVLKNKLKFFLARKKIYPLIHMSLDACSFTSNGRSALKGFFYKLLLKVTANKIFAVSRYNKKFIYESQFIYVGNGISLSKTVTESQTEIYYDFIWIGRFSTEKNPILFIKSCAELLKSGIAFRAIIVGQGPLLNEMVKEITNYNLETHIDLIDWIDDTSAILKTARTLVISSLSEGCPTVALEAMSHGLKIISTPDSDLDWWAQDCITIIKSVTVSHLAHAMTTSVIEMRSICGAVNVDLLSFDAVLNRFQIALKSIA